MYNLGPRSPYGRAAGRGRSLRLLLLLLQHHLLLLLQRQPLRAQHADTVRHAHVPAQRRDGAVDAAALAAARAAAVDGAVVGERGLTAQLLATLVTAKPSADGGRPEYGAAA